MWARVWRVTQTKLVLIFFHTAFTLALVFTIKATPGRAMAKRKVRRVKKKELDTPNAGSAIQIALGQRGYQTRRILSVEGENIVQWWIDPQTTEPMILIMPSVSSKIIRIYYPIYHGLTKKIEGISQEESHLLIQVNTASIDAPDLWTLQDAYGKTIYSMFIGSPQSSSSSSTSSSSSSTVIHIHEPFSNSYLSTPPGKAKRICGHVEETVWKHGESVNSMLSRIGFPQSSSVPSTFMQSHEPYINSYPDTIPERACNTCGYVGEVKRCACRETAYCSKKCQLKHWKGDWESKQAHKNECAWHIMCNEFRYQYPWLSR